MNGDQLISLSEKVPESFSNAITLGALRHSDGPTWIEEARSTASQRKRIVLVGDCSNLHEIAVSLLEIADVFPDARFALLLHWTQALQLMPIAELSGLFDEIYVALDRAILKEQTVYISQRWSPKWVILPAIGVPWCKLISDTLFPRKAGSILLLAPFRSCGKGFLSPDELRLEIDRLRVDRPDIKVEPAPCEWFIPGELGPWSLSNRDYSRSLILHDSRQLPSYRYSAIVPFRWTEVGADLDSLIRCLASLQATFPKVGECEIILCLDSDFDGRSFLKSFPLDEIKEIVVVALPRIQALARKDTRQQEEWRAGFIRNAGARHTRSGRLDLEASTLIFIDSDAEIADRVVLREAICNLKADIFQLADSRHEIGFEAATSMLLAIQNPFFQRIGGFADAFSSYGAEDNFLVWKAQQLGGCIFPISRSAVRHLRAPRETDDLFLKMIRLKESADLMYRMTLDPAVHRHFFVCLGPHIWVRGATKWMSDQTPGRMLLAPFVFVLTLIETDRPIGYLRTFFDAYPRHYAAEYSRRIFYFLRHHIREYARYIYYFSVHFAERIFYKAHSAYLQLKANSWILKEPTAYFNLKTPVFYKVVWRPLLKVRFFLEYHLVGRWRNS